MMSDLVKEQQPPMQNGNPPVWDLVIADLKQVIPNHERIDLVVTDMQCRDMEGMQKYGTRLQPFNGRDALVDAYQELLDAAVYFRQKIWECNTPELTTLKYTLTPIYTTILLQIVELRHVIKETRGN